MDAIQQPISEPRTKRRYRSAEERRRIVEETLKPRVSVATVARAHGINANQVFAWRKLYQAGLLGSVNATSENKAGTNCVRLLPVSVAVEPPRSAPVALAARPKDAITDEMASSASGVMEVTLPKAQIRIIGDVDRALLRVLLECLRG